MNPKYGLQIFKIAFVYGLWTSLDKNNSQNIYCHMIQIFYLKHSYMSFCDGCLNEFILNTEKHSIFYKTILIVLLLLIFNKTYFIFICKCICKMMWIDFPKNLVLLKTIYLISDC